ncbi:MAG TPA: hypothetical protein VFS37_15705 [Conexibacter sp.]|nr:hypothetical protein [Conexibacter sp.]
MTDNVRLVVMGEPAPGTSAFTHVEDVEPLKLRGGSRAWMVWGWDTPPTLPHHDAEPYVARSLFPPPGGVRVWASSFMDAPAAGEAADERDAAEFARLLSAEPVGMYEDPARPGMHRTDSIDIAVVVSGEMTSVADDGSKVVLRAGDVYVQNGAIHNWEWDPEHPAHVVWILLGAERDPASRDRDPLVRDQDPADTH